MLRIDYRQYPTYPHGQLTHLALGLIAASLGAVLVPALAKPDYVAVTFLVLAAQQFRDIRTMERETLVNLEKTKLIKRGNDYIEGIARVFEARNYLVIFTALLTSTAVYCTGWHGGIIAAGISIFLSIKFMKGKNLGDIAEVEIAEIYFNGPLLMVKDVVIMNVGLTQVREKILGEGMGAIIKPKNDDARMSLDAPGQRMALIHDVVAILGSKVDISEPDVMPLARKQPDQGYLGFFILANEPDEQCLLEIIRKVPVLESAQGTALSSFFGRKAAD